MAMTTNKAEAPAEEENEIPEWTDTERRAEYRCEHCGYSTTQRLYRQFIRPEIQEEHFNRWGYPCSCTKLTLVP